MMQVPIRIRFSTKCQRCGLRYPKEESACSHCADLSDHEVQELKDRIESEHAGNVNLGKLFFYITALIIIGMLIINLNGI